MNPLEPDRDQLEIFVDAVLRHRGTEGFLSLRSFFENDDDAPAYRKSPISLKGNFKYLIDCAVDDAPARRRYPEAGRVLSAALRVQQQG